MPFERMLQPEPATNGLAAGKLFPAVDPDCRWIGNEMISSRPQWPRGFSTVNLGARGGRVEPHAADCVCFLDRKSAACSLSAATCGARGARRHPAAAQPVCKSAGPHGIIGDAMKSFLDVATCAPDDRAELPTCRTSLPNRPATTAPARQPTGRSRPRCLAGAGRGVPAGRLSGRAECQCVKPGAAI